MEITLHLDRQAAGLVRDVIYGLGEHQAAAAPLPVFTEEENAILYRILVELENSLNAVKKNTKETGIISFFKNLLRPPA